MRFDSSRCIPSKVMGCLYEGRFAFLTILSGQHPHSILWDFQLPWFFFFFKFAQHAPLPSVSSSLSEKTRYHISLSKRLGLEHVLSQTQRLNVFQITWSPAMLSMKRDGLLLLSSIDYRTGLQHLLPSAPCLPIFPFCSLLNVHFHHKSCPPL